MTEGTAEDWAVIAHHNLTFAAGLRRSCARPPAAARGRRRRLRRRPPRALAADGDPRLPRRRGRRVRRVRPAPRHRRHPRAVQPRRRRGGDRSSRSCPRRTTGWSRSTASSRATTSSTTSASTATRATSTPGHPWYDRTATFCHEYDQPAFDPSYDTLPLEHFEPAVRELLGQPPPQRLHARRRRFHGARLTHHPCSGDFMPISRWRRHAPGRQPRRSAPDEHHSARRPCRGRHRHTHRRSAAPCGRRRAHPGRPRVRARRSRRGTARPHTIRPSSSSPTTSVTSSPRCTFAAELGIGLGVQATGDGGGRPRRRRAARHRPPAGRLRRPRGAHAWVAAGCTWAQVIAAAQVHGLAAARRTVLADGRCGRLDARRRPRLARPALRPGVRRRALVRGRHRRTARCCAPAATRTASCSGPSAAAAASLGVITDMEIALVPVDDGVRRQPPLPGRAGRRGRRALRRVGRRRPARADLERRAHEPTHPRRSIVRGCWSGDLDDGPRPHRRAGGR